MELKVWVESIPRVVCGVTEDTTCQEVIFALAQAIGKAGRFTLVEKWRDTEHLLEPSDSPVQSLTKWGEYASDVQFVLRYSSDTSRSRSHGKPQRPRNGNNNNLKPVSMDLLMRPKNGTNIKRNLTFNGSYSTPPRKYHGKSSHENSSLESLEEQSSFTSSTSTSSPYASMETRGQMDTILAHRTFNGISESEEETSQGYGRYTSSAKSSSRGSTPQDSITPVNSLQRQFPQKLLPPNSPGTQAQNNSVVGHRTSSNSLSSASSLSSSGNSALSSLSTSSPKSNFSHGTPTKMKTAKPTGDNNISTNHSTVPNDTQSDSNQERIRKEDVYQERLVEVNKEELMRLVKLQIETLQGQESRLQVLETELTECETKIATTTTEPSDKNEDELSVAEEIKRLEVLNNDLENDLEELELVSWEDKLNREKQRHRDILTELHATKAKLKACQSELHDKQEELTEITENVNKESAENSKRELDAKNAEIKLEKEIAELKQQIEDKFNENTEQEKRVQELLEESKHLEEAFNEKTRLEEELEHELREVNLQEFKTAAPEDDTPKKGVVSGSTSALSPGSRPGSARKIYYNPAALKEAISSNKDEETCWV